MDCTQWREVLSAALDAEAGIEESAAAREHMAACSGCAEWSDTAAAVGRAVRRAPEPPVTGVEQVLGALRGDAGGEAMSPAGGVASAPESG
ncbi:MAG TPA: zf-HC2 domain-containing protein, partial [Yinghuangia sp.]|nr:zf-HC2 domain-containing protein [Yinghuangia sp.]